MGTYPPALDLIGICCWPNLRIFVYGILGVEDDAHPFREPHFSADELVSLRIEQVPPLGPGPQVILLLRTTTPGSQKSGGAGLGLYSWLLLSNVDTAQLALRKVALPCPASPPSCRLACMLGPENYKVHGRAGAFPSHRKYSTPVRDCTRPGGIAGQEESCISLPFCVLLLLRLSLSMTTTTYQPYNNTLSTCIPPAAVVSLLSPSTISIFCICPPLLCSPYPQQVVWHI